MEIRKLRGVALFIACLALTGLGLRWLNAANIPGGNYPGLEPSNIAERIGVGIGEFTAGLWLFGIATILFFLFAYQPIHGRMMAREIRQ